MFNTPKTNKPIFITQILFYVNAAIWLLFGIASLVRMADNNSVHFIILLIIAVLMFGNALAMLVAGILIGKQKKRWFWLATAVLLINIILTFTDQVGFFDLATLLLDLLILSLLITNRDWFL